MCLGSEWRPLLLGQVAALIVSPNSFGGLGLGTWAGEGRLNISIAAQLAAKELPASEHDPLKKQSLV